MSGHFYRLMLFGGKVFAFDIQQHSAECLWKWKQIFFQMQSLAALLINLQDDSNKEGLDLDLLSPKSHQAFFSITICGFVFCFERI